jgi:hypothetical protein
MLVLEFSSFKIIGNFELKPNQLIAIRLDSECRLEGLPLVDSPL